MTEPCIIYCDESGNDGPNYLEASAPFYVIARWVVPEKAVVDAAVEIESLRQKHCRDATELKFKTFRKKPSVVCETMTRLGQIGLVPIYVVAEKRYCVAGKIVETFLDPYYNNRLSMPFTYDLPTKQELANALYDRLSEKALRDFAAAYREPTQEGLESALAAIAAECRHCVIAGILPVNKSLHSLFDVLVRQVLEAGGPRHAQPLALHHEEDGLAAVIRRVDTQIVPPQLRAERRISNGVFQGYEPCPAGRIVGRYQGIPKEGGNACLPLRVWVP